VALSNTESGLHQSFEFRLLIRGLDSDDQWITPFLWGNQDIETGENVIPLFNFGNIKIPEGKTIGRLHLFELRAGKYEIYRYRGVASGYRKVYEPSGPFSLKFTVLPGQTVYLGNMHFTFPDPLTYRVDIRDMSGRDLKLLKRMYPAIPDDSVMKAVLKLN
jgi:hypothetical protein